MKFVYKTDTLQGAQEIKMLLENAGIPTSISNKGFARLHVHFIPHMLGIFIYNASQYKDAIALLNNKNHVVSNPMNVNAFYKSINTPEMQTATYKAMNKFLLGMVLVGIICGLLLYALMLSQ